jgi:hypothetical protein
MTTDEIEVRKLEAKVETLLDQVSQLKLLIKALSDRITAMGA